MDDLNFCKSNVTEKTHVFERFEKKGSGIEDGCYKGGPVCFIKERKTKIHLPDNSYVVHLDNGRAVYSEAEFNEVFVVVKAPKSPKIVEEPKKPEVVEPKVEEPKAEEPKPSPKPEEPKASEPEKAPEAQPKPKKRKNKKKK
jgi:hypothetical protein